MGLLEESNPFRGRGADHANHEQRVRSGRRTAVAALACSLLWGFGFLSLLGALTGLGAWLYLRSADDHTAYRVAAMAAVLTGVAGLVVAVVLLTG